MAIALNTVIVDGQEYKPGDEIPDFKSIKCVDTREPRKYQGLSSDVSVLNDVIAKYASGGASCFMSDTGEYYEYDRIEKTWKLIANITERGFDSEKAYGALKHMLKNVTVSDEKIQSAVTDYLTVNPVKPGATTEQAQQIEQNKKDVASLKEGLGNIISPNLFNPTDAKENTAINQNDGTEMSFNNWFATGYIPVSKGDVLYFSSNGEPTPYSTGAFYDKDKQRVDSFGNPNDNDNIAVTSDGYARFSFGSKKEKLQI